MKKPHKREFLLLLGLLITILLIFLPVALASQHHLLTGVPMATDGRINLTGISSLDKKVHLDGEWDFYWEHFIVTDAENQAEPDFRVPVPGEWTRFQQNGMALPAAGFASYRLTLEYMTSTKEVTAWIPGFGGAYRLFIDGKLAAESGVLSKNPEEVFTTTEARTYPVTLLEKSEHQVIVEIATTRFSGLYMTPVLLDYNQALQETSNARMIRFILFGIVLFAFFDLLILYAMHVRRKLHSAWMPVMIFFLLLRIMLTSEFFSSWQHILFQGVSYEATNELMYLTTFALKYLLIYLLQEQCGILFSKREKVGFLLYYGILYLVYLLMPVSLYNQEFSQVIPGLSFVLDVYLFAKVYRGRNVMNKYGMLIFWGAIFVVAGLAIDSLYLNGSICMDMSLTLLIFLTLFSLIMRWVYSMRMGDLYDGLSESSFRLDFVTNQMEMQKDYYEALSGQMNEIRQMRHDTRQFVGVMSRLAEENRMEDLKGFLEKYVEKIDTKELPLFCENVIANSIIGHYAMQASKLGIRFVSQVRIGSQAALPDSDLCIVLGNAIENAMDACRKLDLEDNPFILIEATTVNGQFLLRIKNSFDGTVNWVNGRIGSTKSGKSCGFGIGSMEKIITAYDGFLRLEHQEKEFTLMVSIPEN